MTVASPALEDALARQDFPAVRTLFAFLHEGRERAEGQRDALFLFYEQKLRQLEQPGASAEPQIAGPRVLVSPSVGRTVGATPATGATSPKGKARSSTEAVEDLGL